MSLTTMAARWRQLRSRWTLLLDHVSRRGFSVERQSKADLLRSLHKARGQELLRVVDVAVPKLESPKEFTLVLKALSKESHWRRSLRILDDMREMGQEPNAFAYNGVIGALSKAQRWELALALFREMGVRGTSPDLISYNGTISACGRGNAWHQALALLAELPQEGLRPDGVSYAAVLGACNRARKGQYALELFDEMTQRGIRPTMACYGAALIACQDEGSDKYWAKALDIVRQLRNLDLEPDGWVREAVEAAEKVAAEKRGSVEEEPTQDKNRPVKEQRFEVSRPQGSHQDREQEQAREHPRRRQQDQDRSHTGKRNRRLRPPGQYLLPVFAQHDRSNHAERQALLKLIARVQEACGATSDEEFEKECQEVTGWVRLYASHTPCISCMACFCQFQRLFPKVQLSVDFDDWRDTRRMVEIARREDQAKKAGKMCAAQRSSEQEDDIAEADVDHDVYLPDGVECEEEVDAQEVVGILQSYMEERAE